MRRIDALRQFINLFGTLLGDVPKKIELADMISNAAEDNEDIRDIVIDRGCVAIAKDYQKYLKKTHIEGIEKAKKSL